MAQQHWEIVDSGEIKVPENPQEMWDYACKYFKWCDDNPLGDNDTVKVGKEAGKAITTQKKRPYTIKAMCLHCGVTEEYLKSIQQSMAQESMWYQVVEKIFYVIYVQNLEEAINGTFNPVMVTKLLALEKDKPEGGNIKVELITANPNTGQTLPSLAKSENEVLERLELELAEKEKSKEQNE